MPERLELALTISLACTQLACTPRLLGYMNELDGGKFVLIGATSPDYVSDYGDDDTYDERLSVREFETMLGLLDFSA